MYFKHYFYISYGITHSVCGISTKINFSQPGGVNVILQTVRQIDAIQNKAVPDRSLCETVQGSAFLLVFITVKFTIFKKDPEISYYIIITLVPKVPLDLKATVTESEHDFL